MRTELILYTGASTKSNRLAAVLFAPAEFRPRKILRLIQTTGPDRAETGFRRRKPYRWRGITIPCSFRNRKLEHPAQTPH